MRVSISRKINIILIVFMVLLDAMIVGTSYMVFRAYSNQVYQEKVAELEEK